MTRVDRACQATDPAILREQIMDCRVPKSEREWWAAKTIEQLLEALEKAKSLIDCIKQQSDNTWWVDATDPGLAVCETDYTVRAAIAKATGAQS